VPTAPLRAVPRKTAKPPRTAPVAHKQERHDPGGQVPEPAAHPGHPGPVPRGAAAYGDAKPAEGGRGGGQHVGVGGAAERAGGAPAAGANVRGRPPRGARPSPAAPAATCHWRTSLAGCIPGSQGGQGRHSLDLQVQLDSGRGGPAATRSFACRVPRMAQPRADYARPEWPGYPGGAPAPDDASSLRTEPITQPVPVVEWARADRQRRACGRRAS
jgi:hypothetical protein